MAATRSVDRRDSARPPCGRLPLARALPAFTSLLGLGRPSRIVVEPQYDRVIPTKVSGYQSYHSIFLITAVAIVVSLPLIYFGAPRAFTIEAIVTSAFVLLGACLLVYWFVGQAPWPRWVAISPRGLTVAGSLGPVTIGWDQVLAPQIKVGSWVVLRTLPSSPGRGGRLVHLTDEQARAVREAPYHPAWNTELNVFPG